jgi:hypothetical protein
VMVVSFYDQFCLMHILVILCIWLRVVLVIGYGDWI